MISISEGIPNDVPKRNLNLQHWKVFVTDEHQYLSMIPTGVIRVKYEAQMSQGFTNENILSIKN